MAGEIGARRLVALQYFARLPPRTGRFQWPTSRLLWDIQYNLVDDLELSRHEDEDENYKKSFLKYVIATLEAVVEEDKENGEAEVNGELLEIYANLMATAEAIIPPPRRVVYFYPESDPDPKKTVQSGLFAGWSKVTLKEEASMIARGTTGLRSWDAGLRLAAHLVAQPDILPRKDIRIVELGSGAGLLGIIMARQFSQADITLTDLEGIVLDRLRENIERNVSGSTNVTVSPLDWLDVQDITSPSYFFAKSLHPDLVIAADIVFDPDLIEPLCGVLQLLLSVVTDYDNPPRALIASTVRNEKTYSLFLQTMKKSGLLVREMVLDAPTINLLTGTVAISPSDGQIDLLPSGHDASRDGPVKLIEITK